MSVQATEALIAASTSERAAVANRLCAAFAECESQAASVSLAKPLCSAAAIDALMQMIVDGEPLSELAVLLLQGVALHPAGPNAISRGGVLPVLVAVLRSDDDLLREHGLQLLAALAEVTALARPLLRAGVLKLLVRLGGSDSPSIWRHMLSIASGLLQSRTLLTVAQRRDLSVWLEDALIRASPGSLHSLSLDPVDHKRLQQLAGYLRVQVIGSTVLITSGN
jgi:hypothetical protein